MGARGGKKPELGKPCKECGIILSPENCVYSGQKLRSLCRDCHNLYMRKWRENNPEAHVGYDVKQYGLSLEEYKNRVALQLEGCAICKQPCKTGQRLAVDHDHSTKQVRDLLCRRCNTVLGLVNDDELLLFDILDYLKRHDLKKVV